MASEFFYRAMALMITVGALSKIQKIERRNQERSEKFSKLLEHEENKSDRATSHQVVCYYKAERNITGRLQPENIDTKLCTHLIIGFAEVQYDFLLPKSIHDLEVFNRTTALKKKDSKLKVLLSVGAKSGDPFSKMAATFAGRESFIFSALHFLDKYKFDGIDFDWEFPGWRGSNPFDRLHFVLLLRELRYVIEKTKTKFLISAAVAAHVPIIDTSYDVPELAKSLDFVNLMSYDLRLYNKDWPFTGHHSALYSRNSEKNVNFHLNGAWAAGFWEARGMPRKKIMLGIPTHARSFALKFPDIHGMDAPATGPGWGNGLMTYPQVCHFIKSGALTIFDISIKVPYAVLGHDWVAFDDEHSASYKSRFVKEEGYGGVMIYNLNNDDWMGYCDNKTKFPLHNVISKIMLS